MNKIKDTAACIYVTKRPARWSVQVRSIRRERGMVCENFMNSETDGPNVLSEWGKCGW